MFGLLSCVILLGSCSAVYTGPGQRLPPADIIIAGERVFPESITADGEGNIFAGSADGVIYRAPAGRTVAEPWILPDQRNALGAVFGVLADDPRNLLFACSNPQLLAPDSGSSAALKLFSLVDGSLLADFPFPAGPAVCNDIAIAPGGEAFVTETLGGRIFTLRAHANDLALFAAGEELIGVDGIAFAENGALYVNNVRKNLLQRVERDANGDFTGLTQLELSRPIAGPDGLRPLGGNRFLQAESAANLVALVKVEGNRVSVETLGDNIDTPTAVTHVGRIGYVAEGKIRYRVSPELQGQDPGGFTIRSFSLPAAH